MFRCHGRVAFDQMEKMWYTVFHTRGDGHGMENGAAASGHDGAL